MPQSEPTATPPSTAPSSTGMQPTAICVKYIVRNNRPIKGEDVAEYINIDYINCQGETDSADIFDSDMAYIYAIEGSIKSNNPDFNSLVITKV